MIDEYDSISSYLYLMTTNYHYNNSDRRTLRQKLRNDSPKAEQKLWEFLRGSQLNGLKFRRQYGIGPYVVDFYCPELRLAIEIDGDSHYEKGADIYDQKRQQFIERRNIRFLRFTNDDIYENLEGVIEKISDKTGQ